VLFSQRRTPSSLVYVHAALSLPWHGKTAGKSLLFAQRGTHSLLMHVYAALSPPWHGNQAVSLCSSRNVALTADSCMCMRRCLCHGMTNRR
jgi:hypothetical protein